LSRHWLAAIDIANLLKHGVYMKHFKRFLLSLCLGFIFLNSLSAQWVSVGPYINGSVTNLTRFGANIYAVANGGLFCSTNGGTSWKEVINAEGLSVTSLATLGTNLFAALGVYGVILSTDNGASWSSVNHGTFGGNYIRNICISDTNIFVSSYHDIYLSTNNGTTWNSINANLYQVYINTLVVSDSNLFVGSNYGLYHFKKNGTSWNKADSSLVSRSIFMYQPTPVNIGHRLVRICQERFFILCSFPMRSLSLEPTAVFLFRPIMERIGLPATQD
jgi:hypothetical protein